MSKKTPLVLSLLFRKRAANMSTGGAGAVPISAPASGPTAPVANNAPVPGVNQMPSLVPQSVSVNSMPGNATNAQPGLGPNQAIAAAAEAAGKGSGRSGQGMGTTRATSGTGSQKSTVNAQASRFGGGLGKQMTAAAVIPTRQPMTGDQQQEGSVDDTVRQKMQYRWRDKMQKIDQGMSKLELQREQMQAEMQMEEEHLRQTEQLKAEQKQFDEQIKAQKQQEMMSQQMPQFPLGQQQAQQPPAMQQQQQPPTMARQMNGFQQGYQA